ncbi:30S ribosomal protein S1 [Bifidobacterium aemilianum]|uniref:Small ribosomal subunit protein bS1 n=1 Tax=Bifidobacterium aemilianum TaxID=2493120 RepID=A0A366KAH9_9BIFI|nr:30S ribosomal protein S1 [Bifidobacterium aemilianum]RBP98357.1 30S ribosomal protein S1 [Bifidobacterium aemilianum]
MAENNTAVSKVAINDIGSEEDFLKAVDSTIKNFDDGDLVEGTVVKVDHDEVLLDIGYKTEGVIPSRELSIKKDVHPDEVVEVGDQVEALVVTKEDKEGRLILSKKRAQYERAWGDIEKIKDADGIVEGTVIEAVKGGLIVDIGLRGFLPASLVEMRRVRDLSPYIGQTIKAKVLELDKNRNNVVLSRRQYLEETQSEVRETFLAQLKKGQIREGTVSSIVNFGAFVDLGGVDGLIHVSELSWKHIDHPSEVVKVGQKVTVEVLDVDLDRERISLSLKATQEDPWQRFARTHVPGQIVKGKITKIVQFGVFVSVEDGIEGLVHISELANRHVDNPETVVKSGEEVFVKVIDVDLDRRRISLSLKQANDSVDPSSEDFDPALYGMPAEYDEEGNYKYPEGFDPETNEWIAGYEQQREEWEEQYAKAHELWEEHKAFVAKENENAAASAAEDRRESAEASTESASRSEGAGDSTNYSSQAASEGTLADSDQLAALREQLLKEKN